MSDKSWILLAIGGLIGLVCFLATARGLLWIEHRVTNWRDNRRRRSNTLQQKQVRGGSWPDYSRNLELYMEIAFFVFLLSSFLGAIAAKRMLGW